MLDLVSGHVGIGGNEIDVEFERVGASLLHLAGIIDPAVIGDAVEAGDDRDIDGLGGSMKHFEIARRGRYGKTLPRGNTSALRR